MTQVPIWTAFDAAEATGGEISSGWTADGVSIDSRTLEPRDLFLAIEGPNADGHDFAAAALEAGAAAVVIRRKPKGLPAKAPLLQVKDTQEALWGLARAARARSDARIVGVTGSVGKTGVKDALTTVLAEQQPVHATTANLNNQWGVPLTLARMPPDSGFGVIEMGMSSAGEIGPLSRLVRPHVVIITTIAAAHLEFFDSVAAIAEAKAEIFEGMEAGTAVLNRDNPFYAVLAVAAMAAGVKKVIGFGAHPEAAARVIELVAGPGGSRVRAEIGGRAMAYRIGLPGRHWVMNSLAVLAAVDALGADIERAAVALEHLKPPKGRGQRHRIAFGDGWFELIDDSYNASPASVRAALDALGKAEPAAGGRRIAVLGDMLELGAQSDRLHAALANAVAAHRIDRVYTAGTHMDRLHQSLPRARRGAHAPDSAALAPLVAADVRAGDVVMVKGSLGSRMALVVETLSEMETEAPRAANSE